MFTSIKHRALLLIYGAVARVWVQPLEDRVIPALEKKTGRHSNYLLGWAFWWANAGRVIVNEMRVQKMRWIGPDWSCTYLGNGANAELLYSLLFPASPQEAESKRVNLWQVPALVRKHAEEGDLVVCELNPIISLSLGRATGMSFTTPQTIQQVIDGLDRPLYEIKAGFQRNTRQRIRQFEMQGFSFEPTPTEADFDLFYHRMYVPYTKERHTGRSIELWGYERTYELFKRGVLILVRKDGEPVAGGLQYMKGDTCTAIVMGVLDGRHDLVKQGTVVALSWFVMLWAHQQGARRFSMGSSFAFTANGPFNFKRQWGTRVHPDKSSHENWSFFGINLPVQLRDHINGLGFITEIAGKYYQALLPGSSEQLNENKLADHLYDLSKSGIAGILFISEEGKMQLILAEAVRQDPTGRRYLTVPNIAVG